MKFKDEIKRQLEALAEQYSSTNKYEDFMTLMMYEDADLSSFQGMTVSIVQHEGGEGEGDHFHTVYKFENDCNEVAYIDFIGWYASYDGATYEGYTFVRPEERKVVVYVQDK